MGVIRTGMQYIGGRGSAGVAATEVVTVQGIAGGTGLPVTFAGGITIAGPNDAGDAIAVTTTPREALYGYNGTTWDRLRSSIANGLVVDVSRITGNVNVTQGTSPWVVSLASTTITGTVAVTQSTSPWVVSLASTTITGTVAVTQSTSPWVVNLTQWGSVAVTAAAVLADAFANPTPSISSAFLMGFNGATWDRVRTANTGRLQVDVITSPASGGGPNDAGDALAAGTVQRISNYVFNGTTWDRWEEINNTIDVAPTGIPAVSIRASDGGANTWDFLIARGNGADAPANNTHGILGVTSYGMVLDGTAAWNRTRGANADAQAATGLTAAGLMGWNGATWDRLRETIANGLVVDVSRVQGTVVTSLASTTITGTVAVTQSTSPWVVNLTQWGSVAVTAAALITDAFATPTAPQVAAFGMVWNGATWDKMKEPLADGMAATGQVSVGNTGWNGASWDRIKTVSGLPGSAATTDIGVTAVGIGPGYARIPATAALTALAQTAVVQTGGAGMVVSSITNVFVATITLEGWDGQTWQTLTFIDLSNGNVGSTLTAPTRVAIDTLGYSQVRWRVSAFTSGTITIVLIAQTRTLGQVVEGFAQGTTTLKVAGLDTPNFDGELMNALAVIGNNYLSNDNNWDRWGNLKSTASPNKAGKIGQARLNTYGIHGRLATRNYMLSHAFGAAGRFQYLTLFHAATATKNVRLKSVVLILHSNTAGAVISFDLSRLTAATTPATGNPAITPQAANAANTAEVTALCLPTTQGTEASATSVFSSSLSNLGATGGVSVVNPPPFANEVVLWPPATAGPNMEQDDPLIRAGNAEGWAVVVDVSAATTILCEVQVIVTEE